MMTSCEVINPTEGIPAYIHIDSISLQITDSKQGSASHKITDAWVYLNGSYIGTYELPATFPLLAEGNQRIMVSGGIMENGIATTRIFYPFYFPDEKVHLLQAGKTDTVVPVIKYQESATFGFLEDFESAGTQFATLSGDTSLQRITDASLVFEGNAGGAIYLDASNSSYEGATMTAFTINSGGKIFLEMNYKSDIAFQAGIMQSSNSDKYYKLVITPKSSWNKIYINFTDDVKSLQGKAFKLLFKAKKDSTVANAAIYLDNIKLLY